RSSAGAADACPPATGVRPARVADGPQVPAIPRARDRTGAGTPVEMPAGMQTKTKTRLKRIARWTGGLVGLAIAGLAVAVAVGGNRKFDAPAVATHVSKDPAVVERGRYLAFGPAHCVECHGATERRDELAAGKEIPLSGGLEIKTPVGIFRPANI